jgi:hypothetical protein
LTTILQRDVRDLANIADVTAVPRLLSVVATRAGGLLNFADLSRTLGLPHTTLKRYFALLEATFLVQLLRPWSGNLGQRLIQTPKVYLNDTGLLAHLLGLTADRLKVDGSLAGGALENFVLMELRKQSAWSRIQPELFYWRTASGQEVDIVLEDSAGVCRPWLMRRANAGFAEWCFIQEQKSFPLAATCTACHCLSFGRHTNKFKYWSYLPFGRFSFISLAHQISLLRIRWGEGGRRPDEVFFGSGEGGRLGAP